MSLMTHIQGGPGELLKLLGGCHRFSPRPLGSGRNWLRDGRGSTVKLYPSANSYYPLYWIVRYIDVLCIVE